MSQKNAVKNFLEKDQRFRERREKDRGIIYLLVNRLNLQGIMDKEGKPITSSQLIEFVQGYATMDREWRQILEQNPELRGSDYDDKDNLEAKKLAEFGYHVPENFGKTTEIK